MAGPGEAEASLQQAQRWPGAGSDPSQTHLLPGCQEPCFSLRPHSHSNSQAFHSSWKKSGKSIDCAHLRGGRCPGSSGSWRDGMRPSSCGATKSGPMVRAPMLPSCLITPKERLGPCCVAAMTGGSVETSSALADLVGAMLRPQPLIHAAVCLGWGGQHFGGCSIAGGLSIAAAASHSPNICLMREFLSHLHGLRAGSTAA